MRLKTPERCSDIRRILKNTKFRLLNGHESAEKVSELRHCKRYHVSNFWNANFNLRKDKQHHI